MIKNLKIAGSVITAIGVVWLAGYNTINYFAPKSFVVAGFAESSDRQLSFELRSVNRNIYDLETSLDNPNLSPELQGKFRERLWRFYQDKNEILKEMGGRGK